MTRPRSSRWCRGSLLRRYRKRSRGSRIDSRMVWSFHPPIGRRRMVWSYQRWYHPRIGRESGGQTDHDCDKETGWDRDWDRDCPSVYQRWYQVLGLLTVHFTKTLLIHWVYISQKRERARTANPRALPRCAQGDPTRPSRRGLELPAALASELVAATEWARPKREVAFSNHEARRPFRLSNSENSVVLLQHWVR